MIQTAIHARRVGVEDRNQISNLLIYEAYVHRHLDWRGPLDWIPSDRFWGLSEDGRITAAFACPEDPPGVSWIRLFAHQPHLAPGEAWRVLWDNAQVDITASGAQTQVAAIVSKHWFQKLLIFSGFELAQNIILLELRGDGLKEFPPNRSIRIRAIHESDLPAIVKIDREAFGPFWHNTQDSLNRARLQAVHATVAENASGELIGYQISTGNPLGAHLARLAVGKDAQGLGVGSSLLADLIQRLGGRQMGKLSVNTQSDNKASQALYQKMGFVRTGEFFPVFTFPIKGRNN